MNNELSCDYRSDWEPFSREKEVCRFLSDSAEDLRTICDVVELNNREHRPRTAGGIPIRYDAERGLLYTLKEGPHARVEGESGSKKSRAVARPKICSVALNGDSFVVNDPKGELCEDPKLLAFLQRERYDIHKIDLRTFQGDGFNFLGYAWEEQWKGHAGSAQSFLLRFAGMLTDGKKYFDDFWRDAPEQLIVSALQCMLLGLKDRPDGARMFHLASLKRWIRPDQEDIMALTAKMMRAMPRDLEHNPVQYYFDVLQNPERTYACIVSSVNALLKEFSSSSSLLRLTCRQTFDVRRLYREKTAVFLVMPDEVSTFDRLVGFLFNTIYQILVEEFTMVYQDKTPPRCAVHFICDEAASMGIGDMNAKICASRSRMIDWTLIYQSRRQMAEAYPRDMPAIEGNARHHLFLGSGDYEVLRDFSESIGTTRITTDGSSEPLVSVDDLRRMKKTWTSKDALLVSGNCLYTAKLPDYEQLPFLDAHPAPEPLPNWLDEGPLEVYTPEKFYLDLSRGRINFSDGEEDRLTNAINAVMNF